MHRFTSKQREQFNFVKFGIDQLSVVDTTVSRLMASLCLSPFAQCTRTCVCTRNYKLILISIRRFP